LSNEILKQKLILLNPLKALEILSKMRNEDI
jgi:hypothetical protein